MSRTTGRRKLPVDLVYGTDRYAGDDLTLLVLDRRESEAVLKAARARTWGEAMRALNQSLDDYDRDADHPFDAGAEWEFGVLYYAAVTAESAAARIIAQLPHPVLDVLWGHVSFAFGMDCDRCYLRTDESAQVVSEHLRRHVRREVRLVRNDDLVEKHRRAEGWFEK